jgi:ADP-ribose pyrophosphatase YjhB (NUDIX family)
MHPLHQFRYCPKCGSTHFDEQDFKSKNCQDCGFVYYFNSSASTAAFITDASERLLVVRRAKEPAKGTFDLPGGFVDLYETVEEAMIREVKEETGMILNDFKYLFSLPNIYEYSGFEVHTVDLFFTVQVEQTEEDLCPADDVSELFFLEKEKINPADFGLASIKKAIEIWLK